MNYKVRLMLAACVVLTTALMVVSCVSPAKEHLNKGNEYFERGQYDEAIVECTKAIKLEPQLTMAYNNRGLAYHKKGELDKAIADFSKAIELDPNYAEAYFNRAYAYHRKGGEVAKAASDLEKCIEMSTDPRLLDAAKQLLERL